MTTDLKEMLAAANAVVPRITPQEAKELIAKGNVLIVDVREPEEVAESGKIKGALNISRGMLESRADPAAAFPDARFAKSKNILLYCVSGTRSALGGKLLKDMGYPNVFNLGGFKDWIVAGGETEDASAKAGE
jgi:rhodanese-related sulfurtransferase